MGDIHTWSYGVLINSTRDQIARHFFKLLDQAWALLKLIKHT